MGSALAQTRLKYSVFHFNLTFYSEPLLSFPRRKTTIQDNRDVVFTEGLITSSENHKWGQNDIFEDNSDVVWSEVNQTKLMKKKTQGYLNFKAVSFISQHQAKRVKSKRAIFRWDRVVHTKGQTLGFYVLFDAVLNGTVCQQSTIARGFTRSLSLQDAWFSSFSMKCLTVLSRATFKQIYLLPIYNKIKFWNIWCSRIDFRSFNYPQ